MHSFASCEIADFTVYQGAIVIIAQLQMLKELLTAVSSWMYVMSGLISSNAYIFKQEHLRLAKDGTVMFQRWNECVYTSVVAYVSASHIFLFFFSFFFLSFFSPSSYSTRYFDKLY